MAARHTRLIILLFIDLLSILRFQNLHCVLRKWHWCCTL